MNSKMTPHYISFWDGYENITDFDSEAELKEEVGTELAYEIHTIELTEKRLK